MHGVRTVVIVTAMAALVAGCSFGSGADVVAPSATASTTATASDGPTAEPTTSEASSSASGSPSPSGTVVPLPESVLSPMTGYAYAVAAQLLELEATISTSVSPDAPTYISGVTARIITFNGTNVGTIFRFRCAESVPLGQCGQFLLGFQQVWTRGTKATAARLGDQVTHEALVDAKPEGTVAWARGRTAIMIAAWDGLATARRMATAYVAATPDTAW
jgi:hypothetical protein